jgi:hydrogen cyanide synthase HcnA
MAHRSEAERAATGPSGERRNDIVPIGQGELTLTVDGQAVRACQEETVLTVLTALGQRAICRTDRELATGAWCGMGICYACLVLVNGQKARACQVRVEEGMQVRTSANLFET